MSYQDLLKHPNWQKKRLEVMDRAGFRCQECGENEKCLHVHHKNYINGNKPWEYSLANFLCLCEDCHNKKHGKEINQPVIKLPPSMLEIFRSMWKERNSNIWGRRDSHFLIIRAKRFVILRNHVRRMRKSKNSKRLSEIFLEIRIAERSGNREELERLCAEFKKFKQEIIRFSPIEDQ